MKDKADDVVKPIIGYELHDDQSLKMQVYRKHFDHINDVYHHSERSNLRPVSTLPQIY